MLGREVVDKIYDPCRGHVWNVQIQLFQTMAYVKTVPIISELGMSRQKDRSNANAEPRVITGKSGSTAPTNARQCKCDISISTSKQKPTIESVEMVPQKWYHRKTTAYHRQRIRSLTAIIPSFLPNGVRDT